MRYEPPERDSGESIGESLQPTPTVEPPTPAVESTELPVIDAQTVRSAARWTFQMDNRIWTRPVHAHGSLYANDSEGSLYAWDLQTGELQWKREELPSFSSLLYTSDDAVLYLRDGTLWSLDPATGELRWTYQATSAIASCHGADGIVYVAETGARLVALDPTTGKTLWSHQGPTLGLPIWTDDRVYYTYWDGGSALHQADMGTGELRSGLVVTDLAGKALARVDLGESVLYSATAVDDTLYFFTASGLLYAVEEKSIR